MVFVDPNSTDRGGARSNVRLYGDLQPVWRDSDAELVVGKKPRLQFGLQRRDETSVDPGAIAGSLSWSAELEYADGTTLPMANELAARDLASPVELDLSEAPAGPAVVHLTLRLTTAPAGGVPGTTLEPQAADYPVTVRMPPSYPEVAASLDFGSGDTADPVSAPLNVTGDGCVWLANAETLTLPEGVASAKVTADASSESACVSGKLPITLTPSEVGSGLLSGTLQVLAKPTHGASDPASVTVSYRYELERPPNQKLRVALFAVLLVLGLLIPLLLLIMAKWWTAKIPGSALSWVSMSGPVGEETSFLGQAVPDLSRLQTMSLDGADRRSIEISPRATLRAKAQLRHLSAPGHVVVAPGPAVTSAGDALPLAVQNHWIATLDPVDPGGGPVEVIFLLVPGAAALSDLLSDARANVPGAVWRLRNELGVTGQSATSTNEWGVPVDLGGQARGGSNDQW